MTCHTRAPFTSCLPLALLLAACPAPEADDSTDGTGSDGGGSSTVAVDGTGPDGTGSTTAATDDGVDSSTGESPGDDALELLERLPGLWIAPVTSTTSVGDFPIMAMDMRPADDRTIFSRVDLDAGNNLRFAFTVEEVDGAPTLIFRNGGYFLGILRDTRTALMEHDPEAETWRFCAIAGGCGYVEALVDLSGDQLDMTAWVMGRPHMHWVGMLAEERPLDGPFPYDETPGSTDDPFPAMPTLRVTLSWADPLPEPTEAWIILSTTDCGLVPGSCSPSRFLRGTAETGATSIELTLDQIHAGDYRGNAVLDRNGNLGGTLFPDNGDLVSIPNQAVTVADMGESSASISLLVEL
ncbi:MAG: hypothetical protein H6712_08805 [Myxococcales bacterium]|nr:hypothetical protein [Myxococcales bacterium]MCB9713939.1 hypothetical protein [Myxococcales bacterium]